MVKVRYSEGVAIHTDPESCAGLRRKAGAARGREVGRADRRRRRRRRRNARPGRRHLAGRAVSGFEAPDGRPARYRGPVPVGNLIRLASEAESRNVSIL